MRKIGTALRFDSACARWLIVFNDMLMWSLGLRITEGHWTLSYQTWPVPREHYLLSSSSSVLSCLWPTNSLSLGMRSGLSREHVRCRTWLLPWIRERWSDQIDCCDSSENDPFKMNLLLFKLLGVYCNSSKMPNVVEFQFPWSWILLDSTEVQRKKVPVVVCSYRVYTSSIRRRMKDFHAVVVQEPTKNRTKQCAAQAQLLFCFFF